MKLVANAYAGPYNPENKPKPIARIFEISDAEKKKYGIGTRYVATDLDGPKRTDFGEWRELSRKSNEHLFFVPVYTILEAHKSIESNIRYAQLGQISIKCLGMSADIDSERLSLEEVSTLLKDMCQDIIINKCISFEYLISRPEPEYTSKWKGDVRYV